MSSKATNHSAGNWRVVKSQHAGKPMYEVGDALGRRFARMSDSVPESEARANAYVMAESPKMLKALQNIVLNAKMIPDPQMNGTTDCYSIPLDDFDAACLAVQKAVNHGGQEARNVHVVEE